MISHTEEKLRGLVAQHNLAEIELGLSRISKVLGYMGSANIPFVYTIGGTNGKGTCGALLAAALQKLELRVGLYSSPHLYCFEERLQINGTMVSVAEWCHALDEVERVRHSIPLTYFEYSTLAAFYILSSHSLDIWILEVGLGGRHDAVNILATDCAVITSIDLDHIDRLGNQRSDILYEKIGITRAGKPLVYGDPHPPDNFHLLIKQHKPYLLRINQHYGRVEGSLDGSEVIVEPEDLYAASNDKQAHLSLESAPDQLTVNIATAWQALIVYINQARNRLAQDFDTVQMAHAVSDCWQDFTLAGRWQQETLGNCSLLFDVAHNPAAAHRLCDRLAREEQSIEIVFGLMRDKDWAGFVQPLRSLSSKWHVFPLPLRRALDIDKLTTHLTEMGASVQEHDSALALLDYIQRQSQTKLFVFCGSFHLIGESLAALNDLTSLTNPGPHIKNLG